MATLAESVISGAQDAVNNQQHTVGNAVQAYQVAQQAQHATQELEMEKQSNDINKANWLMSSLDKANRTAGPIRNAMIDSLKTQYQKLNPGADPKVFDVLQKQTPEDSRQMAWNLDQMMKMGGASNPDQAGHVLDGFGSLDGYTSFLEKGRDYQAKLEGARAMAAAQGGKTQAFTDRNQVNVSGQYNQTVKPLEDVMTSANRVQAIISRIKNGELKSTPTLTTDLSMALAGMLNKGAAATVSGSENAGAAMQSMAGEAATKYGFVAGQPMNSVTPAQLDQLDKDVGALKGEYSSARKNVFGSWIQGMPTQFQPGLMNRFNTFKEDTSAPQVAQHLGAPAAMAPEDLAHMTDDQISQLHQQKFPQQYPQEGQDAGGN